MVFLEVIMKRIFSVFILSTISFTSPSWADIQRVTLSVPDMNCPVCPITVQKSLEAVNGVKTVETSLENKEAVVTYDDEKVTLENLTLATKNTGYPSTRKDQ